MSDKLVLSIVDKNFLSTPNDVLKQFDKYKTALRAAAVYLQKKVQMRIPTNEGLVPRNVVVSYTAKKAKVEVVPIRPRKKKKAVFNPWVKSIEYKKKPFLRPAFDESELQMIEIFNAVTRGII